MYCDAHSVTRLESIEFAHGGSLSHWLYQTEEPKYSPMSFFIRICEQIALAMNFIHSNRIIHRDLKSDNILLSASREVKIADFGIATKVFLPILFLLAISWCFMWISCRYKNLVLLFKKKLFLPFFLTCSPRTLTLLAQNPLCLFLTIQWWELYSASALLFLCIRFFFFKLIRSTGFDMLILVSLFWEEWFCVTKVRKRVSRQFSPPYTHNDLLFILSYMAPEVMRGDSGESYDWRVDVFSAGIIMNEIFSREIPFRGLQPCQVIYQVALQDKRPPLANNAPNEVCSRHRSLQTKWKIDLRFFER